MVDKSSAKVNGNGGQRIALITPRTLEYFTEKELTRQIGRPRPLWPLALIKEMVDNSLDAAEDAGTPPVVRIDFDDHSFAVSDNGPGIPDDVIRASADYTVRVSTKSCLVGPTRGQLGNALKTLWAAPYVAGGGAGPVTVECHGLRRSISVRTDEIAQRPEVSISEPEPSIEKTGTSLRVVWPDSACLLNVENTGCFYNASGLVAAYATFNPHADIYLNGLRVGPAPTGSWRKWRPQDGTSPHWYSQTDFRALIASLLRHERSGLGKQLTVRELVASFKGLSGSEKARKVLDAVGLAGSWLKDLAGAKGVDADQASALLGAMRLESRPVKPNALGLLGEAHLRASLVHSYDAVPGSIRYRKVTGVHAGRPYMVEVAFSVQAEESSYLTEVVGINWTPCLAPPFDWWKDLLKECLIDSYDPATVVLHIAMPGLMHTDHGKVGVSVPLGVRADVEKALRLATSDFTKEKRRIAREERLNDAARTRLSNKKDKKDAIRAAAFRVMEQAYLHVSEGGQWPAHARQLMYAARPLVLEITGGGSGGIWKNSAYFTQTLLKDFMLENRELTSTWDVVFDARGHFTEPHTGVEIGIGTIGVRDYMKGWHEKVSPTVASPGVQLRFPTCGPANRFSWALFVEKEGFDELFERAALARRWDIALFSTKGVSVEAARRLIEELSIRGVSIMVLRDFDLAGFKILRTLYTDSKHFKFKAKPNVIDLGLHLAQAKAMNLQDEQVMYKQKKNPRDYLKKVGATPEEAEFLVSGKINSKLWQGRRIELNAMTSRQLLDFVEARFREVGVQKVVPDDATLTAAYTRARRLLNVQRETERATRKANSLDVAVPANLAGRVQTALQGSKLSWDEALLEIARKDTGRCKNRSI